MDPNPCSEGFRYGKDFVVVSACHLSSGLDEAVPFFLAVIELSNVVERDVPKYVL